MMVKQLPAKKKKRKEDSKCYEPCKVIAGNIQNDDEQVTIQTLNPQIGKDTVLVNSGSVRRQLPAMTRFMKCYCCTAGIDPVDGFGVSLLRKQFESFEANTHILDKMIAIYHDNIRQAKEYHNMYHLC